MERLDDSFYLLIVGSDNEAPYRKMAQRSESRTIFAGEQRNLETLYPAADAFVFPTAYETFSLVCMEAMASGVPVFATRVGGIENYLEDGVNGYAILQDAKSLADAVESAFSDASHLEQLKVGARETALCYRWEEVASRYVALAHDVSDEKLAYRAG
jgi:UDP-glucose:(heptosyl)LPS alpha-1,3-glucosyltransferase